MAIENFRISELYDNLHSSVWKNNSVQDDDSNEVFFSESVHVKSPGLFVEVSMNISMASILLTITKNRNEKNILGEFMQGKDVEIEKLFDRAGLGNYKELAPTLAQIYTQSKACKDN